MSVQFMSDWQLHAPCGRMQPERFEGAAKAALSVCATCPVRRECLEHALASPWQPYGIWGGLLQNDVVTQWRTRHPRASRAEVLELMGLA